MEPNLSCRKTSPTWSRGQAGPSRVKTACLRGGRPAPESPVTLSKSFSKHLRVLYKMGICSVDSLYLLRTPMSRGLPLL